MEIEELKQNIKKELKEIEEMIINGEEKDKIELKRKKLDAMLEQYMKYI